MKVAFAEPALERAVAREAERVAKLLLTTGERLVLAESCTGGLVSAALVRNPGISERLCGSAVVYREDTKRRWLGVSSSSLRAHGAVSERVAREMAAGALKRTPEASLAAAITGNLGPGPSPREEGRVFIAIQTRRSKRAAVIDAVLLQKGRAHLLEMRSSKFAQKLRAKRQLLASLAVLYMVRSLLEFAEFPGSFAGEMPRASKARGKTR